MEKVTGIGGVFFRARDHEALQAWYRDYLGVTMMPTSYGQRPWHQAAGPTVWGPFPHASEYFGNPQKVWMVNFRVDDLNAMVSQLRAGGITVDVDPDTHPNGRFARTHDPEGNPIELWQPA